MGETIEDDSSDQCVNSRKGSVDWACPQAEPTSSSGGSRGEARSGLERAGLMAAGPRTARGVAAGGILLVASLHSCRPLFALPAPGTWLMAARLARWLLSARPRSLRLASLLQTDRPAAHPPNQPANPPTLSAPMSHASLPAAAPAAAASSVGAAAAAVHSHASGLQSTAPPVRLRPASSMQQIVADSQTDSRKGRRRGRGENRHADGRWRCGRVSCLPVAAATLTAASPRLPLLLPLPPPPPPPSRRRSRRARRAPGTGCRSGQRAMGGANGGSAVRAARL